MKKQNKIILLSLMAFLMLYATSCLKDDDSEKRANEKRLIENYVQNNNVSITPSTSGLYFIPQEEGTGATPGTTDYALIKYTVTDLDGKFYDGTDKAKAELNKVYPYFALGGPLKIYAGNDGFLDGVIEGLKLMKEGGKARMIMPSILAYNDYIPRVIDVELVRVISNPMAYEKEQIANFLDTASNLQVQDSTSSGIYYIERVAGTGTIKPFNGKVAKIRYKGYLPDGRVFDKTASDTVFKFRVGASEVINGLDEGIRLMTKGGQSTMVIPYYRGYGFAGITSRNQIIIPYFSTLVFDIELVDVVD
jgi:FKBP-type peptidyl-prolyl cis-trans isomerase